MVVEFLDRAQQAEVALLDQVAQRDAAVHVAAGDADHQPQVGLDQPPSRLAPVADLGLELLDLGRGERFALAQALRGGQAGLDRRGQLHLRRGGQQRDPADFLKVDRQGFAGAVRLRYLSFDADDRLLRQ